MLRDHLISHLLAAISAEVAEQVVFFGGTALARTVIPDGRLSEDIDLVTVGMRTEIAQRLATALPRAVRREFPGLTWQPSPVAVREPAPAILLDTDGLAVRIQLLSATGYPRWPTQHVDLVQRYRRSARQADRADRRWVHGGEGCRLVQPPCVAGSLGPVGARRARAPRRRGRRSLRAPRPDHRPDPADYAEPPDQARWERDLGAQIRLTVTAADAAEVVAEAWRSTS